MLLLVTVLGTGGGMLLQGVGMAADSDSARSTATRPEDTSGSKPDAVQSERALEMLPCLDSDWWLTSLPDRKFGSTPSNETWAGETLGQAIQQMRERKQLVLPCSFPVASKGSLAFRTYDGLFVVNLRENNPQDRNMWAQTDGGVTSSRGTPDKRFELNQWRKLYESAGPYGVVLHNSINGTVTTDGTRALLIDDLVLPPHPDHVPPLSRWGKPRHGSLHELASHNSLKAYNLESMKLLWSLGAKRTDRDPPSKAIDELADSFFLGPPLPLGRKLYVLVEKWPVPPWLQPFVEQGERTNEMRLVCLEARDKPDDGSPPPDLRWSRRLGTIPAPLSLDVRRRIQAVRLAAQDDMLICPSNAGFVCGFDLRTGAIWTHTYRQGKATPYPDAAWGPAAPVIQDGKVVFTAPDDDRVHCLDLQTGRPVWTAAREDDLYLAGAYADKVLLVGKTGCRALRLTDGEPLWRVKTGVPSGQGVAIGDSCYLLPLHISARTQGFGLCVLSLEKGKVLTEVRARQMLGNLVFCEAGLVSQTVAGVTAFRSVKLRLGPADLKLTTGELERFWADLEGDNDARLHAAIHGLAMLSAQALPFLESRVRPVAADEAAIARAVADLGSNKFHTRMRAARELERLGELAEPALRDLIRSKPGLDLYTLAQRLVAKADVQRRHSSRETTRLLRAVKVLELSATAEARRLLAALAKGTPVATLTRAAKETLERLDKRAPAP
jgi:hypothetical protein